MAHRILTPETILEESLRVQRLANATFKVPASSSTTSTVPATPTPTYFQQDMPAVSLPSEAPTAVLPIRRHKFPTPKLRLKLYDLGHEGSSVFLSNIKGNEDIEAQVQNVLNLLYSSECERQVLHLSKLWPGRRTASRPYVE
ncbi:hypothetical protein LTR09_002327 [Extremus antarcticus]|uniref:Uncharacterized protein n=1 Tax=Extremus antarcticus TaxID=702011 RepID=A0AAJ0GFI2_9PEZI|nr:hypothetical protein LTR09_002327 [Extremus antarcticus]